MKGSLIIGKIVLWAGWALLAGGIALAVEGELVILELALAISGTGLLLVLAGEGLVGLAEIETNTRAAAATLKRIESRIGDMNSAIRQAAPPRNQAATAAEDEEERPRPARKRRAT